MSVDADGDVGLQWRVIGTDTESDSGVAPVCPQPDVHAMMQGGPPTDTYVFDECCIGPHLECWSSANSRVIRDVLNRMGVEMAGS